MAIRNILQRTNRLTVGILFLVSTVMGNILWPAHPYAFADDGIPCDYNYYEEAESKAYDRCFPECGGDSAATGGGFIEQSKLNGKTNREKVYRFWIAQGLTTAQAAGIAGSMQAEGGFSPFRQETTQTWPAGGYGIAQFTGGQRDLVTTGDPKYNLAKLGDMYTTYYSPDYGGGVGDSGIPDNIPKNADGSSPVNDAFLLTELNYLGSWVSNLVPGQYQARVDEAKKGGLPDVGTTKLLAYIKTLKSAGDAAKAWTFLYEYPGDIQNTANVRAGLADNILKEMTESADALNASCPSGVNCPTSGDGAGASVGDGSVTAIVSAATCMAAPGGGDAGRAAFTACQNGGSGYTQQTVNYIAALNKFGIPSTCQNASSCATFVSAVLRLAGVEDSFWSAGSTEVDNHLRASTDKYEALGHVDAGNKSILKAGDILAVSGHTMIVIADGGDMMATASWNDAGYPGRLGDQQPPWWSSAGSYNGYNAYRLK